MSDFQSKHALRIENLEKRLVAVNELVRDLEGRRTGLSFDASQGNKTSLKEIAQIDTQVEGLQREHKTLSAAIAQAQQLAQQEQQELLNKHEQERQREARNLAAAAASLNEEIDQQLIQLRGALERRAENLNQLARLRVIEMGYLTRMGKDAITAGFCAAGLHRFADIRAPAPTSIRALATANKLLGGIGGGYIEVEPAKRERVKLNE